MSKPYKKRVIQADSDESQDDEPLVSHFFSLSLSKVIFPKSMTFLLTSRLPRFLLDCTDRGVHDTK